MTLRAFAARIVVLGPGGRGFVISGQFFNGIFPLLGQAINLITVHDDIAFGDEAANRIYFTNSLDGTLSVLDGKTNVVLETVPAGRRPTEVALSPSGDRLYVADMDTDTLTVLNARNLAAS